MMRFHWSATAVVLWACCLGDDAATRGVAALQTAERLSWLRNWAAAQPYYAAAERQFEASGDNRNAAFARISRIRGELNHLPLLETSQYLATQLDDATVQSDLQLRLRCLVVKGDVDLDLDTGLAYRDWSEARSVAEKLGHAAWVNRANGELAIVSFLSGNHQAAALGIVGTILEARRTGDVSSVVRYEALVGNGLVQWKQYEKALKYFDDALEVAKSQPEIQYPLLVYSGKIEALIGLGRSEEAKRLLDSALAAAQAKSATVYEGELHLRYGLLEFKRGSRSRAIEELRKATELADSINCPRIAAQSTFTLAQCLEANGDFAGANDAILRSVQNSRQAGDRALLPATLAEAARINIALRQFSTAHRYFEEASDIASAMISSVSNLTGKGGFIASLDRLHFDHFRLHATERNKAAAFAVVEQVHGRAVADALQRGATTDRGATARVTAREKQIARVQLALMRSRNRTERRQLLLSLERAEEEAYPAFAARAAGLPTAGEDRPVTLAQVQRDLTTDQALLEYFISEPRSYCLLVSRDRSVILEIPGRAEIQKAVDAHLDAIEHRNDLRASGRALFRDVLPPGTTTKRSLIVVPDGPLHRLPFDTMFDASGQMLLASHTIWYAPSGTVLHLLANRRAAFASALPLLAVSAGTDDIPQPVVAVRRNMFDLQGVSLPALPGANSEARLVGEIIGPKSVVITGPAATETAVKSQPLNRYRVLHFAVHGLTSPDRPERAGLVFFPDERASEDGLWQVREIERTKLQADLVTLSACRAGSGKIMGPAGIANLVTPFLAAGAESVVANLWDSDDAFTRTLMRSFYTFLSRKLPAAEALRRAKLEIQARYGPEAPPYLWAGFILSGVNRQVLP